MITNRIVRTRSLPDNPRRVGRGSAAPVAVVSVIAGPIRQLPETAGYSLLSRAGREFRRNDARGQPNRRTSAMMRRTHGFVAPGAKYVIAARLSISPSVG